MPFVMLAERLAGKVEEQADEGQPSRRREETPEGGEYVHDSMSGSRSWSRAAQRLEVHDGG